MNTHMHYMHACTHYAQIEMEPKEFVLHMRYLNVNNLSYAYRVGITFYGLSLTYTRVGNPFEGPLSRNVPRCAIVY